MTEYEKSPRLCKMIMIMIDGFGIPSEGWENSVFADFCGPVFTDFISSCSIPLDACLGMPGIPQSATGQTALFTGFNAAEIAGRHLQGFPGPTLRELIGRRNILSTLARRGLRVSFANAYPRFTIEQLIEKGFCSVTSVMASGTLERVLSRDDLLKNRAVYHDLTRSRISVDYDVPEISPAEAALHLVEISSRHDFTLFEYFMSDRAGHKCDPEMARRYLSEFSVFLLRLRALLPEDTMLVMTSDHGNCEDLSIKTHTLNNVPFLVYPPHGKSAAELNSILDVYHYVVDFFGAESGNNTLLHSKS